MANIKLIQMLIKDIWYWGVRILPLIIVFLLVLEFSESAHAAEANPLNQYNSFNPVASFEDGEGHGYAEEYVVRNKTQFVAWLKNGKKRVECLVFVRQIAQVHRGFPGEACEGTAHEIESNSDYATVACTDQMLKDNWLAVTDVAGKKFGAWHRRCYTGEQLLTYKGRPVVSTTCGNPLIPIAEKVQAITPSPTAPAPFAKYALQINCMRDRDDGYWLSTYEAAKARRAEYLKDGAINKTGMVTYYEVFTKAPFGNMLSERKSRPLDCKFFVRFVKKEPVLNIQQGETTEERAAKYNEYLKQFQYPDDANVISRQWVSTGARGWVIIPVTIPLDQFEAVLIQPENMGDVLEPLIAVHKPEFAGQSNPVHIWEVKRPE